MSLTSLRSVTLGVVVTGLATAALVAPAHADTRTDPDARGDVKTIDLDRHAPFGLRALDAGRAPGDATIDVRSVKAAYKNDRVRWTVGVTRLAAGGYQAIGYVKGGGDEYFLNFAPDGQGGGTTVFGTLDGQIVPCEGSTGRSDTGADTVTLTLPAECIGDPAKVRTNAAMASFTTELRFDQGLTTKAPSVEEGPVFGPRLAED